MPDRLPTVIQSSRSPAVCLFPVVDVVSVRTVRLAFAWDSFFYFHWSVASKPGPRFGPLLRPELCQTFAFFQLCLCHTYFGFGIIQIAKVESLVDNEDVLSAASMRPNSGTCCNWDVRNSIQASMEAIDITCLAGINNWSKVVAAAYGISSAIKLTFGFNKLVCGRGLVDLHSFC